MDFPQPGGPRLASRRKRHGRGHPPAHEPRAQPGRLPRGASGWNGAWP